MTRRGDSGWGNACFTCCFSGKEAQLALFANYLCEFYADPPAVSLSEKADGDMQCVLYFAQTPDVEKLHAFIDSFPPLRGMRCSGCQLIEDDWVALSLQGLKEVRAGHFLLHGGHEKPSLRRTDIALCIDAGQAFGTGHHPTTLGCLLAIDELAGRGPSFAPLNLWDCGCGSGVLAMAAKRVWPKASTLASDIDPVAVRVCKDNAQKNSIDLCVIESDGAQHTDITTRAPYDMIFANILLEPLGALIGDFSRLLRVGGCVLFSGLIDSQTDRFCARLHTAGFAPCALRIPRHAFWPTMLWLKK